MYGALTIAPELLTEAEKNRYRACYCGLCRCLGEKYGNLSRMALSYDLTFLVLFLNSLNEPEELTGSDSCIVHPFKKREWWRSEYTEYAADITLALAALKFKDNWQDGFSLISLAEYTALRKTYSEIKSRYPSKLSSIEDSLAELRRIEKSGRQLPDEAADCFGNVMSEVLDYKCGRWSPAVRDFGMGLGQFIYVHDAALDLEKDRLTGSYNPFLKRYGHPDNPVYFREILAMLLDRCAIQFSYLPLVLDSGLLKNIICIGLWSGFNKKFGIEEGPSNESGSI